MPKPKAEDVEALVEIFEASDWDELEVEIGDFALYLSKQADGEARARRSQAAADRSPEAKAPPATSLGASTAPPVPENWIAVRAPNLGTFYRAPKPGAAPYVEVGQTVGAETEVCLIEVMKLFTTVRAGASGTIGRICVADAELVEFGQILFLIEPRVGAPLPAPLAQAGEGSKKTER